MKILSFLHPRAIPNLYENSNQTVLVLIDFHCIGKKEGN